LPRDAKPLEVGIHFHQWLAGDIEDAHPLNAPSPSVPVRPLTMMIEPLSRTSALPDTGP
jgi:hypothetical protein